MNAQWLQMAKIRQKCIHLIQNKSAELQHFRLQWLHALCNLKLIKLLQVVYIISMISQIYEIFNRRNLAFWANCAMPRIFAQPAIIFF